MSLTEINLFGVYVAPISVTMVAAWLWVGSHDTSGIRLSLCLLGTSWFADTYFEPNRTFPELQSLLKSPTIDPLRGRARNAVPNYWLSRLPEREAVQTAWRATSRTEKTHEAVKHLNP